MRFLVLTEQWFPDYAGGSGRVATETAIELARSGHTVEVVAPQHPDEPRVVKLADGLTLRRTASRGRIAPQTLTDPIAFRQRARELRHRPFDWVVAHQPSGVFAAKSVKAPVAFVFHASGYREALHRRSTGLGIVGAVRSLGVEQPLHALERRALRSADVVLVLSEFSRSLLAEYYPWALEKVVVAGGGIDTDRFSPSQDRPALRARLGIAADQTVLLTVRRLVPRTGVGQLIDAMAQPATRAAGCELVIIGGGEDRDALEAQARAADLGSTIRFLGRVSDEDVVRWYQAADLFVLPTVAYEGFGMSTAEALACGTPVVGTPVGATPALLGATNAGFLSLSAEPADLSAAIIGALERSTPDHRVEARRYAADDLSVTAMVKCWLTALDETRRFGP